MSSDPVSPEATTRCPCGTGEVFGECCGPVLRGERRAPTATALMRSRYTAFAVGDTDYLLASWHPDTRPAELDLDPDTQWLRLDIESSTGGTPFDTTGTVVFAAHHRSAGVRATLRETSDFEKVDGRWFYRDGIATMT